MIIEQNDRDQTAPYHKLEIECSSWDSYELLTLILIAASNTTKIFDIMPSCGVEHMIGMTIEPHGGKSAILSLHFAENDKIDPDLIKEYVQRLLIADRLNAIILGSTNPNPFKFVDRWGVLSEFYGNGKILSNVFEDFHVDQFPQVYTGTPYHACI
jgi:hypothetical protein